MLGSELFLDLYKQLEDELDNKYRKAKRRFSSVIFEFTRDSESEPVRDKLEICREVRNVLTHNANLGGQPIIEPSEPVIEALREIIAYVNKPPLAIDYATKGESIMRATPTQKVLRVMEVMDKNGYSHVPVMQNGEFAGVFSMGAVFMYILKTRRHIGADTTIQDMASHIQVKEHVENYAFVPADASYIYVRKQFEVVKGKNKRVSVVFITETGRQDERLLGMLTPLDVLGEPC